MNVLLCHEFGRSRKHIPYDQRQRRNALIGELRGLLAASCVEAVEPDLVIGEAGGSGNVVRTTPIGVITTLTANSPVNVVRPFELPRPTTLTAGTTS
jgi:hypothetical protein